MMEMHVEFNHGIDCGALEGGDLESRRVWSQIRAFFHKAVHDRPKGYSMIETTKAPVAAVSRLAYPEIPAAITRRHRAGEIETGAFERIKKAFKADWTSLTVIEMRKEVRGYPPYIIEPKCYAAQACHLQSIRNFPELV